MKGIIFDFNGTMVFDSHLHEQAWVGIIQKYKKEVTAEEVIDYIHGRTNNQILPHFLGEMSDERLQQLSDEKETIYQSQVRQERLELVAGTEELLDQLVEKGIPFTIATASPKFNVDFYFDYFELGRWFDPEAVIYDDGTFPGKPEPFIYQKAAEKIGCQPAQCVVIEDAVTGIESANRAGIGRVFVMIDSGAKRDYFHTSNLEYEELIEDFHGFLDKIDSMSTIEK